jgi:hypothetical protein
VISDAVNSLDGDEITVYHVHDPVPADAQAMVPALVGAFLPVRIIGKSGCGCAYGPHAILVAQETAR